MQARKPVPVVLSAKSVASQFLDKEPRIVGDATPNCQARISFASLSIPPEQ
jgi:hypothetical protein